MKKLSLLLLLFYLLPLLVQAQTIIKEVVPAPFSFTKVLSSLEITPPVSDFFKVNRNFVQPSQSPFLLTSLGLFEGLKFQSALDQFASIPMFDSRAYKPKSISDYNSYLHRNYLILNSSFPKVW